MDSNEPVATFNPSEARKRKRAFADSEYGSNQVDNIKPSTRFNLPKGKHFKIDRSPDPYHAENVIHHNEKSQQTSFPKDNTAKRFKSESFRYFSADKASRSECQSESSELKMYGLPKGRSAHDEQDGASFRRNKREEDGFRCPYPGDEARKKSVENHSEEKDLYFKQAMETVKQGIDEEALDIFVQNVLEQTEGEELLLSCQCNSSYCIQFLLDSCNDLSVLVRFMKAFEQDRAQCCGNRYASHITESLLYYGLKNLQNWKTDAQSIGEDDESGERSQNISDIMSWICGLSEFCLENLKTCLDDSFACYVLRSVIQVLGGRYFSDESALSRKSKSQKVGLQQKYLGEEYVCKPKTNIILSDVPRFFVKELKKFAKAFKKLDDIKTYAFEARTVPVLCSLLLALKERLPKTFLRISSFLTDILFEDIDGSGVPQVLLHRNCSYVVEKLFQTLSENQQDIWDKYISSHLEKLIGHPVGNFVLQRLFDVIENPTQFEVMYQALLPFFQNILDSRHYGIFVSLTAACMRLKCQQAQMTKDLMQCLGCDETEDKQECFVRLVLGFQHLEEYLGKLSAQESNLKVILQGSLVVQNLLKFHKPIKVVRSILCMKPDEIDHLACHTQGCHVLTGFLAGENVGEKNKMKFLNNLKPILTSLVCDRNGSLTLCRMWTLLTTKQKTVIAQELASNERNLRTNSCAHTVLRKFGIHLFKNRLDEWRKFVETIKRER